MLRLPIWILLFLCSYTIAQERLYFVPLETEEPEIKQVDVLTVGMGLGPRFLINETAEFDNEAFLNPVINQEAEANDINIGIQLFVKYRLDHYLFPGIAVGLKWDYSFTNIDDIELEVIEGGNQAFVFEGGFLGIDTFAFTPHIEIGFFSLIEYLAQTDLPPYMEVRLYAGMRLNINIYDQDVLDVEDLDTLVIGLEVGGGVEIFLSDKWSLYWDISYAENESEFEVEENGAALFSGDLNLTAMRSFIGIQHYF